MEGSKEVTRKTITNWTTDDKMVELLAEGVQKLKDGDDKMGRAYLGAMGKGISFRRLKLLEAASKKKA